MGWKYLRRRQNLERRSPISKSFENHWILYTGFILTNVVRQGEIRNKNTSYLETIDGIAFSIIFVTARIGIGRNRGSLLARGANERIWKGDGMIVYNHIAGSW